MSITILVSIFMGSKSDLPVVNSIRHVKDFGISHKMFILSAHRTPEEVVKESRILKIMEKSIYSCCRYGCTSSRRNSCSNEKSSIRHSIGAEVILMEWILCWHSSNAQRSSCSNFCNRKIWGYQCGNLCSTNYRYK